MASTEQSELQSFSPHVDLKAERLNRGLSVDEIATEAGVPSHVWRTAEDGTVRKPRPVNAFRIATYLGYRVTDIWPVEGREAA